MKMVRTAWTINFENKPEQRQLEIILKVCGLETANSVSKDDLRFLLKWLAERTIE